MAAPFQSFPTALLMLSPRVTRVGDPAASVAGINTTSLGDGCWCYCIENKGVYQLDRTDNTTPADGNAVIAPSAGPGRWFKRLPASGGASPIVRLGFDNSTETANYPANSEIFQPVLRSAGQRLQVPLTGFTPGNLILIEVTLIAATNIASGPSVGSFDMFACVDVGAGFQNVSKAEANSVTNFNPRNASEPVSMTSFVRPPAPSVTAAPVVGVNLQTALGGLGDQFNIEAFGAFLAAYEVDASFVTQMPTTVLLP